MCDCVIQKAKATAASLSLFFISYFLQLPVNTEHDSETDVICVTKQQLYPRESARECFTQQDGMRSGETLLHIFYDLNY